VRLEVNRQFLDASAPPLVVDGPHDGREIGMSRGDFPLDMVHADQYGSSHAGRFSQKVFFMI